jgi:hypothetical protein
METIRYSETLVHTRYTRRHIPKDGILYSHRCENLKSFIWISCLLEIFIISIYISYSYSTKMYIQNNLRHCLDFANTCSEKSFQVINFACNNSCLHTFFTRIQLIFYKSCLFTHPPVCSHVSSSELQNEFRLNLDSLCVH